MRLFGSPTSPFVRKVRIVALEKRLGSRVTLEPLSPYEDPAPLLAANPLAKIPTLVLEDGSPLYDSVVIAEYLDGLEPAPALIPPAGPERFAVLRRQALCDGVMDAAVSIVMEHRRPETERSGRWLERWRLAIERGVEALQGESDALAAGFRIDAITAAAMLGYLDFRMPELDWRARTPDLARWWAAASERESVAVTAPPA